MDLWGGEVELSIAVRSGEWVKMRGGFILDRANLC